MIEEQKRYREAVDSLYSVFADYSLRPNTEACPCCHEPEDEPRLHSKPLRELTVDDLESYGHSAMLTWGTVEDLKHFLPRLFEITTETSEIRWVDTPVIFAKLRHAEWCNWPENERHAMEEYVSALWQWFLADANHIRDSEDLLCGIAHAVDDLAPFLAEWRNSGLVGLHKLAEFVADQAL